MKLPAAVILILSSIVLLVACSKSDPGPLAGTWKSIGTNQIFQFRSGKREGWGIIEKVSYEVRGQDVLITYKDGLMKGITVRYTLVDPDTARSELNTLKRVK